MAEYIERDDLIRRFELSIKSLSADCNSSAPIMARTYEEAVHRIENLPTADVVPVVRCKDCTHYKDEWCEILKAESPVEDGFCCYGERRCE